jgi:hypothetical protein
MVIVNVNYILLALEKHTSFLQYEINYDCKKFYDTGPSPKVRSQNTFWQKFTHFLVS